MNYFSVFVWLPRIIDLLLPAFVLLLLPTLIADNPRLASYSIAYGIIILLTSQYVGIYSDWHGKSFFNSIIKVIFITFFSWTVGTIILLTVDITLATESVLFLLNKWFILTLLGLLFYRFFLRLLLNTLRSKGYFLNNFLIIGTMPDVLTVHNSMTSNRWSGNKCIGFIDLHDLEHTNSSNQQIKYLGNISEIVDILNAYKIDEAIVITTKNSEALNPVVSILMDSLIRVKIVASQINDLHLNTYPEFQNGIIFVNLNSTPLSRLTAKFIKRSMDIIISSLLLIILSPVFMLITACVKISSPGPILFKQNRVTINNKVFTLYKFRSMPINTDQELPVWGKSAMKIDSKFGALIRKSSLDELPQLMNVLKGDMSLVGPRPEIDIYVDQFKHEIPRYVQKHMVRAGLTGLAQINGLRGDTSIHKRIAYDLQYIANWSFSLDCKILFKTVFIILSDFFSKGIR